MSIVREVTKLTHSYAAKGGSDNRRQQVARMLQFAQFAASLGASSIGQVGQNHVIKYWKSHRELADSTLYSHWRAIVTLWELSGKNGVPPKPRLAVKSVVDQSLVSDVV